MARVESARCGHSCGLCQVRSLRPLLWPVWSARAAATPVAPVESARCGHSCGPCGVRALRPLLWPVHYASAAATPVACAVCGHFCGLCCTCTRALRPLLWPVLYESAGLCCTRALRLPLVFSICTRAYCHFCMRKQCVRALHFVTVFCGMSAAPARDFRDAGGAHTGPVAVFTTKFKLVLKIKLELDILDQARSRKRSFLRLSSICILKLVLFLVRLYTGVQVRA